MLAPGAGHQHWQGLDCLLGLLHLLALLKSLICVAAEGVGPGLKVQGASSKLAGNELVSLADLRPWDGFSKHQP